MVGTSNLGSWVMAIEAISTNIHWGIVTCSMGDFQSAARTEKSSMDAESKIFSKIMVWLKKCDSVAFKGLCLMMFLSQFAASCWILTRTIKIVSHTLSVVIRCGSKCPEQWGVLCAVWWFSGSCPVKGLTRIWMLRQCLLLLLPTLLPPDSSPGYLLRFFAIKLCTDVSENVVKNHPKPCQFS